MAEWGEGGLRIVPAHPLLSWLESRQLLPELRFSVSSRRDNGLNQGPLVIGGALGAGNPAAQSCPFFPPGRTYFPGMP